MGKKIPDKEIEIKPMNKFTILPTLKIITKDAEIIPSAINGIDPYIVNIMNNGTLKISIFISKIKMPIKI